MSFSSLGYCKELIINYSPAGGKILLLILAFFITFGLGQSVEITAIFT